MKVYAVAGLLALALSVSAGAQELQDEAPAPDAPFDENPFDLTEPENELDALSRSTADPFPNFEETQERRPLSVTLRALDKITAQYTDIEAPIGEPARFNSLEILPRFCDKRPPEEFPETTAFLEIFDRDLSRARASASAEPRAAEKEEAEPAVVEAPDGLRGAETASPHAASAPVDPDRIFSGWMFASSPSLNALEHPVYDVWVIDCTTELVESEEPAL